MLLQTPYTVPPLDLDPFWNPYLEPSGPPPEALRGGFLLYIEDIRRGGGTGWSPEGSGEVPKGVHSGTPSGDGV